MTHQVTDSPADGGPAGHRRALSRATRDCPRLLVLSYHFPPDPAMGGMRWAGLTKYLAQLGWRVWVVTAAPGPEAADGVSVESCPPGRTLSDLYRRCRAVFRTPAAGAYGTVEDTTEGREPAGRLAKLRAEGAGVLALLSEGRGWALRAALRARRVIRRVRPHVVVSSSPPVAAHLAAWLATRGLETPWLADLRDPWSGPVSTGFRTHPFMRSRLAWAATVRLEQLVLGAATGIITTTPELAEVLRARYPRSTVTWLRNGADRQSLPDCNERPYAGLSIAHVGALYGGRSLSLVLRALRLFLERHPEAAADGTRLRSAGYADAARTAALQQEITALQLERHVELLGVVSRVTALDLVARSRLIVVLAQDQETEIPGKLYEALAIGTATVAVTTPDSATGREAKRLGVAVVEPNDVEAMVAVLEAVWSDGGGGLRRRQTAVDYRDLAASVSSLLGAVAVMPSYLPPLRRQ